MGASLSSIKLMVKLSATLKNTLDDGKYAQVTHPKLTWSPSMTDGVDENQADRAWQSEGRTLADGQSEVIDLYDFASIDIGAGTGKDGVGLSIVNEEIVAIAILNDNEMDEDGQLEIVPTAAFGWTPIGSHTVANGGALRGQGLLLKACVAESAFCVEDGVSHRIKLTASGGDVSYSIYLLFRHDWEVSSSSSLSSSSSSISSSSSLSSSSLSSSSLSSQSSQSSSSSTSASSTSRSSQSNSSYSSSSTSSSSSSTSTSSLSI